MNKKTKIVSLSGISGSGKTTIVTRLHQLVYDSQIILFDSYEYDQLLHKDFLDWFDHGADYNEWNLAPIINDIHKLLNQRPNYIFMDYPFGYKNKALSDYIDFAVYIDIPLDIAMARRIIRDYGKKYNIQNEVYDRFNNLNKTLTAYLNHDRQMYEKHISDVKPDCDFVVDGTSTIDNIVENILKALSFYKPAV